MIDEERVVELDGARLSYRVAGSGPALVLIHGLAGSSRWWARNVGPLAERFTVYAVDLLGFGASRGQRFVLADAAGLLARWLDGLGIYGAGLVGHSLGGLIALDLAAEYPELIARLVLVDAAIFAPGSRPLRYAVNLLRQARYTPLDFTPVVARDALRAGPRAILSAGTALLRGDPRRNLPRLRQPALLIWGERDVVVPVSLGEELAALLPGARLVVLPGAGHNPMWDRPEAFDALVIDFLAAGENTGSAGG
ncbi:MAG TPA: alpha/beta fold hydrolase [Thermomicrobiaceae bacterium]|nr:alpha/beta fold hydrolase [Thermomicrobiaceae bacterium]